MDICLKVYFIKMLFRSVNLIFSWVEFDMTVGRLTTSLRKKQLVYHINFIASGANEDWFDTEIKQLLKLEKEMCFVSKWLWQYFVFVINWRWFPAKAWRCFDNNFKKPKRQYWKLTPDTGVDELLFALSDFHFCLQNRHL